MILEMDGEDRVNRSCGK